MYFPSPIFSVSTLFTILLLSLQTLAALNSACTIADGTPGACLTTASCSAKSGTSIKNFCPNDPADVRCCTKACGDGGKGHCRPESGCDGETLVGLCPGPSSVKCCMPKAQSPPSPPPNEPVTPPMSGGGGATNLSDAGAKFIGDFEGFRGDFYNDAAGIRTIGYGHACQNEGDGCDKLEPPIDEAEAQDLLRRDAEAFIECVNEDVTVPLNQRQYDALISFTFNLGCGNEADIAPVLNSGDFKAATEKMLGYVHAGKPLRVLQGLVRRRKEEVEYFNS